MKQRPFATQKDMENAIDGARGATPVDVVLKGAKYLDVFSCKWLTGDIAITNGRIVGVGDSYQSQRSLNFKGQFIVPGFIDSHVHIESSMMAPDQFQLATLPRGTTGAIVDPHEIVNVMGTKGLDYILEAAEKATMDIYVMLSSCVPATDHLETSGAKITVQDLLKYKNHPKALGLAEMMNFPGVLNKDPEVMSKLFAFQDKPIDGHCPMLRGKDLSAYIASGVKSCHESVTLDEAREKLEKGMQVLLREGSVAKNLKDLCKLLTPHASPKLSLCTDDRNPVDILDEGHLDFLIRLAIKCGIEPAVAYRSASWSTAIAYGLNGKGAIAPGYDADLVVLNDFKKVSVKCVFKMGTLIKSEKDIPKLKIDHPLQNSIRCEVPALTDFAIRGPEGLFRVIEVIPNQIITKQKTVQLKSHHGEVQNDLKNDILKISVLERHGHHRPLSLGFVHGMGFKKGAIGSTVGHDSHNAVVVGTNDQDMRDCYAWLKDNGGGFVAIVNGKVLSSVSLPIAGLMTNVPLKKVYQDMTKLRATTKKMGSSLHEPFLQLAFLCLPVIPDLKITDVGLIDVNAFKRVDVRI